MRSWRDVTHYTVTYVSEYITEALIYVCLLKDDILRGRFEITSVLEG